MVERTRSSKRKGAEAVAAPTKPTKKAKIDTSSAKTKQSAPSVVEALKQKVSDAPLKRTPRKRAADLFDKDEKAGDSKIEEAVVTEEPKKKKVKAAAKNGDQSAVSEAPKTNKGKKAAGKAVAEEKEKPAVTEEPSKGKKKDKTNSGEKTKEELPTSISKAGARKGKKATPKKAAQPQKEDDFSRFDSDDSEDPVDAAALLAGFETSDSESDDEDDGIAVEKLPAPPKPSAAAIKEIVESRKAKEDDSGSGVVYIGRIPHGFYEHQMRAYFSQFGDITRLRLARNKRSGASKHYAFIEFESAEVADIVAKTMNSYLIFGHILRVRRMAPEQVHENLWKGANQRFKKIPWAKIEARQLKAKKDRATWEKKIAKEEKKREAKKAVLEKYGYEFEMPVIRKVQDVPIRDEEEPKEIEGDDAPKAIENGAEKPEPAAAIEAAPVEPVVEESEESKPATQKATTKKAGSKAKKGKAKK